MSKLEMIALSGVVYRVKKHWSQHRALWNSVDYFSNKKKTKFEPAQIFHTNLKVHLLM